MKMTYHEDWQCLIRRDIKCAVLLAPFIVALLSVMATAMNLNAGVAWQTDLEKAVAMAGQGNRLLYVHFYGDNCPPCKQMDNTVFTDIQVIEAMNKNFVAVKVHTSKQQDLANRFGVKAIPTDIVLKPNGQLLHRRQGGISNDRFVEYLGFLVDKAKNEGVSPVAATHPGTTQSVVSAAPVAVAPTPPAPPVPAPSIASPQAPPQAPKHETTIRDPFTKQVVTAPPAPALPPVVPQPAIPAAPVMAPATPTPSTTTVAPPTPVLPQHPATPVAAPPIVAVTAPAPSLTLPKTEMPVITTQPSSFREPPPGPPSNMDEVPKTMVEVPLGLEGYCPVVLSKEERWVPGNPAYYTMFRGHVFRFSSEEAMAEFAKSPLPYSPVAMGEDIVQMVNRNKKIYGNRKFGVWYQGRVFLFSSQESLDAFAERPGYYAEIAVQYETAFKGAHGLF